MFENLSNKLELAFNKLKGFGKLSESNIQEGLKEVRFALLEADVHYKVVKKFIDELKEKAVGQKVLGSLTPTQQLIKIVFDDLKKLMGDTHQNIALLKSGLSPIMLVGLQGSGKTTTAAKLAFLLKKDKRNPLLVPVDVYRPAAFDQLKKLGMQINIPVFDADIKMKPLNICLEAKSFAEKNFFDTLIIDTAGRLHIDEPLVKELVEIKNEINPSEILFIADAMTGQDAINSVIAFDEALDLGGIILTKLDGDAKGGAALSVKAVTGKPLKFIGVGEKIKDLEPFHPDRMAQRILGMGDTLSLIEKAQSVIDEKEAKALEKKLRDNEFTLEDFKKQLTTIKKMGSLQDILKMIPGLGAKLKDVNVDDKELIKTEAIINSMTKKERNDYNIIKANRKIRIAKGSGTTVCDVNNLLKKYMQMLKMIKQMQFGKKKGFLPF